MPITVFIFTLGRYYGFYYDNHYFNLLALDLMDKFKPYFYIGSHYSIHSTLFSYLLYPVFIIFGPTDLSIELVSGLFHLLTVFICFRLGRRFYSKEFGLIFAALVALAPIHLINIYTWPELSFVVFLNLLSIYYFLVGFQERAKSKLIISSILYSLSCFQKIYSLLLLPFFVIYSLAQVILFKKKPLSLNQVSTSSPKYRFLNYIFYLMVIAACLYLIFLCAAMFISKHTILYYAFMAVSLFLLGLIFRKLSVVNRERLKFCALFMIIVVTTLLLLDLFVQVDIHLFKQRFGYYRDTTYAGGFGVSRPVLNFTGKEISIFKKEIYPSVLSSLLSFRAFYTRTSSNLWEIQKIFLSYYKQCLPLPITIFLIIGIVGLIADMLSKKNKLDVRYIFPLVWLSAISISFINANPYHIMRVYVLPLPYFFAALGIYYIANLAKYLKVRINNLRTIITLASVALVFLVNLNQLEFLVNNVYKKYKDDKAHSMYYPLFHGWPYGRSYKEVGEFLLKDAPLKKDGKFKSIFIYTIAPDTAVNICAIFYNAIDWYTQNKIKIIYDAKYISNIKYGSALALAQYLHNLFSTYPGVEVIYFADFYDTKDNFSFFSKIHKELKPYRLVNDDESIEYDCILYKFERDTWQAQMQWKDLEEREIFHKKLVF